MKKIIGFVLLLAGMFFSFSQMNMTGFVVVGNFFPDLGLFSLIIFFFGMVLIIVSSLEKEVLTKREKEEIKTAFRGWDGRSISNSQKKILRKYGLETEQTSKTHRSIYFPYSSYKVFHSGTSGDVRSGLNFALKDLIPYIERNYKK